MREYKAMHEEKKSSAVGPGRMKEGRTSIKRPEKRKVKVEKREVEREKEKTDGCQKKVCQSVLQR